MLRFKYRPLTVLVCCLFTSPQMSHAALQVLPTPAQNGEAENTPTRQTLPITAFELAALNENSLNLRKERKFNVIAKKKAPDEPPLPVPGQNTPEIVKEDDKHPMFIMANELQGRNDESTEAIGEVELRKTGTLIYADRLTYWPLEDEVDATGNVRLIQEGTEIDTPHLRMKLSEQIGFVEQADFHITKFVANKLYQTNQTISVTNATTNTTVSGAPMMLNVPDSYGLPTTMAKTRVSQAYGHAERINFEGENQVRLINTTYSTCKPGQTDWYLQGSEVKLDYDENRGEASHASVWFKDVPLLYAPSASFSLNNQRKSGLLHPTFSASTKNGFDLTLPYYWNIAPNYDLTLHPRYMSKRGFQLGADAKYLDHNFSGSTKIEYMPEDNIAKRERYGYNIQHTHNLGRGISAAVNFNKVSDDLYRQDMSSRLLQTSQVQLPQQVALGYTPAPWLQTSMQVLRYQTLQPDPLNPIASPYFLEPQLNLIGYKPNVLKTDIAVLGQFSRFTHSNKIQADRMVLYPQLSLPIVHPAFQITPKIGMHMTQYSLGNVERFAGNSMAAAPPNSISRTLPIFSLDANLTFEREIQLLDTDYIQTLEPRIYYVHIPYRDQSNIPVFDSGLTDFNFAQIFAENRYSGLDRVNDANQLTAAVTTRVLDAATGIERFKAMLGQRYYFKPQQVTLPGETVRNANFSNLIAGFTGLVLPKTYADAAWEYDYSNGQSQRFSVGARYQPEYGKVLSASYRYTRDPLTTRGLVDQIDIAGQWPLNARWYAVGRYNYSIKDDRPLETVAGFEYNTGCWSTRFVAQRLEAIAGAPNTTVFLQLELNDFGSIGSNPIQLLRRTIPGYGKSNELPHSGSLLTTE